MAAGPPSPPRGPGRVRKRGEPVPELLSDACPHPAPASCPAGPQLRGHDREHRAWPGIDGGRPGWVASALGPGLGLTLGAGTWEELGEVLLGALGQRLDVGFGLEDRKARNSSGSGPRRGRMSEGLSGRGQEGSAGAERPHGKAPLTALSFSFCTNSAPGTPVTFRIWVSWSRSWQRLRHSLALRGAPSLPSPPQPCSSQLGRDAWLPAPSNRGQFSGQLEQVSGGLPGSPGQEKVA